MEPAVKINWECLYTYLLWKMAVAREELLAIAWFQMKESPHLEDLVTSFGKSMTLPRLRLLWLTRTATEFLLSRECVTCISTNLQIPCRATIRTWNKEIAYMYWTRGEAEGNEDICQIWKYVHQGIWEIYGGSTTSHRLLYVELGRKRRHVVCLQDKHNTESGQHNK